MIRKTATLSKMLIHAIHLFVRWGFISIAVLLLVLTFRLIHGITIEHAKIRGYEVEGLYLKLDKKLVLRADKVTLPQRKADPSFLRIDKTFDNVRYIFELFDEISLYRVDFNNKRFAVFYADDILYIRSDDYEIAGNLVREGTRLIADIPLFYVKRFDVRMQGTLHYNYESGRLNVEGAYETDGIKGKFTVLKRGKEVQFALNSEETDTIRPLIARFRLHPAVKAWIVDKIEAKRYKLDYLKGRFFIRNVGGVSFDFGALEAQAQARNVVVKFHKDVPPAQAEKLIARFKRHTLTLVPEHPYYVGKRSLEGTQVMISHLGDGKPPILKLDLYAVSDIGKEVHAILKAYKLHIPVRHNGKRNRAHITLRIPLKKVRGKKRKIDTKVVVIPDRGTLFIEDMMFPLCGGGEVRYDKGRVHIRNVCLQDRFYAGVVDGTIDMVEKKGKVKLRLKRAVLKGDGTLFLSIKGQTLKGNIDFKKEWRIAVDPFGIRIRQHNGETSIDIARLSKLMPYIYHPFFKAKEGKLHIVVAKNKPIRFEGVLEKKRCVFYDKGNTHFTRVPFSGTYDMTKNKVSFEAFNGRLHYIGTKNILRLHKLDIDLERLLKADAPGKSKTGRRHLIVKGSQSEIRYGMHRLVTDTYHIELFPNGDIKAYGSLNGDIVKFSRKHGRFIVNAYRIRDKMLHPLIRFKGLKKGRYSLHMQGDPQKEMKGRIIVEGGILSDFKAYNNTLAFINAIPALATLNSPGFSKRGFVIEVGIVEFTIKNQRIIFDRFYLKGKTATLVGKGTVDIKTGKLDIDLAVRTVKDFSKIVSNIPIVGYLLLGEDKSVTIGLKVSGTLQNPKIETSVAKDVVSTPFRLIKRLLSSSEKEKN